MSRKTWIRLAAVLALLAESTVQGIRITSNPLEVSDKTFAYVIVGGGTAGLTVASRLAEDARVSVLVIEAGPDAQNNTLINDPGAALRASPGFSWQYNTTVQTVGSRSLGLLQGKVLGGTSSINGLVWTRGTSDEYDSIEELGNPGWGFQSIMRYTKKAESFHLPNPDQVSAGATAIPSLHGYRGKVNAGFPQPYEAAAYLGDIVTAARAAIPGLESNPDGNSGTPHGAGRFQYSLKPGNNTAVTPGGNKRSSSATSYIYPSIQEKPNLVILTGHQATGLVWGRRLGGLSVATGVKFITTSAINAEPGPAFSVKIKNEVIVSSGAVGSPHFLELSGIGDKRILSPLGIPVEVDLPAVGTNLQERALARAIFSVQPNIPQSDYTLVNAPFSASVVFADLVQMLGTQLAQKFGNELRQSIPARAKEIVSAGGFASESGLRKVLSIQARAIIDRKAPVVEFSTFASGDIVPGTNVIGTSHWSLSPQWRGTVHVKSANPNVRPELNPRFFQDSNFDLYLSGNATKLARKMFNTEPLKKYLLAELSPTLEVVPENPTDSQVQNFVTSKYAVVVHAVGSVPMLPQKDGGAVGPDLVVYGTKNVRVADTSIIPIQLSAHPSWTVYGVAEKVADMIKDRNRS